MGFESNGLGVQSHTAPYLKNGKSKFVLHSAQYLSCKHVCVIDYFKSAAYTFQCPCFYLFWTKWLMKLIYAQTLLSLLLWVKQQNCTSHDKLEMSTMVLDI